MFIIIIIFLCAAVSLVVQRQWYWTENSDGEKERKFFGINNLYTITVSCICDGCYHPAPYANWNAAEVMSLQVEFSKKIRYRWATRRSLKTRKKLVFSYFFVYFFSLIFLSKKYRQIFFSFFFAFIFNDLDFLVLSITVWKLIWFPVQDLWKLNP